MYKVIDRFKNESYYDVFKQMRAAQEKQRTKETLDAFELVEIIKGEIKKS